MSLLNDNNLPVVTGNITTKFREPFESFTDGVRWNLIAGANDLIQVDGNAAGSSYLVISKDPFSSNTETSITSIDTFDPPIEVAAGISLSQRVIGQEFSMELISTETPTAIASDVAISSISQNTTILTANTATNHNLFPGDRIGVYGVAGDSRLNYTSCVVATIPSSTQFTVTNQVNGALPSVTSGPFTTGYVTKRPSMNGAKNGFSQIFETASATQASFYVRGSGGDVLPSGTIATTHATTVGSTASIAAVSAVGTYVFQPTTEYRFAFQADRIQAYDGVVDSSAITANRSLRTQIVPDSTKQYKLRYRARNVKGLSVPNVAIISATKSGSATATVTTDGNHGLTTGDYVVIYGVRDQTNFLQSAIPFQVLSTPTTTSFTAAWGLSYTGTTYGGYVSRINGSVVPGGFLTPSIQTASIVSSILYIIGNATWNLAVGDYVNLYGVKVDGTGSSVGIDGVYRVRDVSTVNVALEPIGSTSIPSSLGSTACGGAIIKRSDLRISFSRIFDYIRERVEVLPRPDAASSIPANITGGTLGTVTGVTTVTTVSTLTGGGVAEDAATSASPIIIGGVVRTANTPTTLVSGDACRATMTNGGAITVKPFAVPETDWQYNAILTTTTPVAAKAAGITGIRNYVTGLQYQNTSAIPSDIIILDGVTVLFKVNAAASMTLPGIISFNTPLRGGAANALNLNCGTAGANIYTNIQGYQAA